MATVIDVLVVELGLDPAKFTKGQKESAQAFLKTREDAVRVAKGIESQAEKANVAVQNLTSRFLGLLSIMVGGYGLKEFIVNTTRVNAETGQTAQIFETTTKALSAWRTVATLTGGTAAGITAGFGGLIQQFQQFALTGESSVIPYFRALNVDIADVNGKMRNMDDIMLDLADRFSKMDPSKARAFGTALGLDDATVSLLLRGRDAVKSLYEEAKALGTVTKEDAEASAELVKQWNAMETAATSLGRRILTTLQPALSAILKSQTDSLKSLLSGKYSNRGLWLGRALGLIAEPGSGAEPNEAWTGGRGGSSLRTKPGAGTSSLATSALAHSLQSEIPGLDRFTAFNDPYHQLLGRGSAHTRGQALDFTLKDASQSAAVAAQVRAKLAAMGVDARVIDEYTNPSKGSTGGHIHVQFNSAGAAQRYSELAAGAPGAARAGVDNSRSSTSTADVKIGTIVVNTQATDAAGIAKDIGAAVQRNSFATQAQAGAQ